MKKILTSLMLIGIGSTAWAQSYNSPESIEFDYDNNQWFIANNGAGNILKRSSATGALSIFVSGIPSGPHGLEIVNDTLYVCDGGSLKAYNKYTGAVVFNMALGASFLNGITHDNSGYLYITDFSSPGKIYRFNTSNRTYSLFASPGGSPNGIYFDQANNRCVFVNWGASAAIKAVDITTGVVTTVVPTTLGNCDGISRDGAGNWYVSSWSGGSKVTRFTSAFATPTTVISTGLSSPADIFYNVLTDTLGVPNSGAGNNTTYHYFGTSTGIAEAVAEQQILLSPNPMSKTARIDYFLEQTGNVLIQLYDEKGALVRTVLEEPQNKGKQSAEFSRTGLSAGTYILKIDAAGIQSAKKILITE